MCTPLPVRQASTLEWRRRAFARCTELHNRKLFLVPADGTDHPRDGSKHRSEQRVVDAEKYLGEALTGGEMGGVARGVKVGNICKRMLHGHLEGQRVHAVRCVCAARNGQFGRLECVFRMGNCGGHHPDAVRVPVLLFHVMAVISERPQCGVGVGADGGQKFREGAWVVELAVVHRVVGRQRLEILLDVTFGETLQRAVRSKAFVASEDCHQSRQDVQWDEGQVVRISLKAIVYPELSSCRRGRRGRRRRRRTAIAPASRFCTSFLRFAVNFCEGTRNLVCNA